MSYENTTRGTLRALAKVHRLCFPEWPCNRLKCKRCRKRHEESMAWANPETYEVDESAIWGIEE